MGTFHVGGRLENHDEPDLAVGALRLLVGVGSASASISESVLKKIGVADEKRDVTFTEANGQIISRKIGYALFAWTVISRSTKSFLPSPAVRPCWARELWRGLTFAWTLNKSVSSREVRCCPGDR